MEGNRRSRMIVCMMSAPLSPCCFNRRNRSGRTAGQVSRRWLFCKVYQIPMPAATFLQDFLAIRRKPHYNITYYRNL